MIVAHVTKRSKLVTGLTAGALLFSQLGAPVAAFAQTNDDIQAASAHVQEASASGARENVVAARLDKQEGAQQAAAPSRQDSAASSDSAQAGSASQAPGEGDGLAGQGDMTAPGAGGGSNTGTGSEGDGGATDPSEPGGGNDGSTDSGNGGSDGATDPDNGNGGLPVDPDKPIDPEQPEQPETPDVPDPEQPDVPEAPEVPEQPETPQAPDAGGSDASAPSAHAPGASASASQNAPAAAAPQTQIAINHYSKDLTVEKFIASIAEPAREVGQENNLYASVMIAQAVLESGSGSSVLSQSPYNNLFGIKGAWKGMSVSMATSEDDGTGALYGVHASFRAYDSVKDSLQDYADLLREDMGSFYSGAWRENAPTAQDAALYLQGRYATDTSYAQKIMDIVNTYDLYRYDNPLFVTAGDSLEPATDDEGNEESAAGMLAALVGEASSQVGVPYVWGGEDLELEGGFDCSGLVLRSFKDALDVDMPRVAADQSALGEPVEVSLDALMPGDTLYFANEAEGVYHTALYIGDGYYVQAPQPGENVTVTGLDEWVPSFAKRILDVRPMTAEEKAAYVYEKEQQGVVLDKTCLDDAALAALDDLRAAAV